MFWDALKTWRNHVDPGPQWSEARAADAILKWAIANKRWPSGDDWHREELPSRHQLYRLFNRMALPSGIESNRTMDRVIHYLWMNDREAIPGNLLMGVRNVTIRRRLMERRGVERILKEGGGRVIQEDDFGKLWQMPSDNFVDQTSLYVEVVNSTPEPDGTYAHYFLRVPPQFRKAQQAVAWTFSRNPWIKDPITFAAQT